VDGGGDVVIFADLLFYAVGQVVGFVHFHVAGQLNVEGQFFVVAVAVQMDVMDMQVEGRNFIR